jgi:glycosyltransferase involved in cell wall biosynthesis
LKRLLLVAYQFPPLAGSGTFRPLRFSRYLPRHGWEVTVLSVSARVRLNKDPALLDHVPSRVEVIRTATLEPRNLQIALMRVGLARVARALERALMVPDAQRGWVPFAVRAARRALSTARHDVVLSTSAPYSAHLVARTLARRPGVPWVADFRDEWTGNPYLTDRYPTAWHRRYNLDLERSVLREAAAVVSVSSPWLENQRRLVPDQPEGKFHVLPNGYDPSHFDGRRRALPKRFRVLYAGTFYGHRSPAAFLEGFRLALERGRIGSGDSEILLVGHGNTATEGGGLPPGVLRTAEHRPYLEILDLLHDAAALLLVVPRAGGAGNHTGKLFDYLASGTPILALAPTPNVAADLILESRSGLIVPPDDPQAVADALGRLYDEWRSGGPRERQDREVVRRYAADVQARALAAVLDGAAGEGAGRRHGT